jgi:metal-responsive CopG/Arc/MetJ family transcriptional regulator
MKKKTKSTHGGPRKGSGRPTTHGRRKGIGLSLTPDVLAYLDAHIEGDNLQLHDSRSRSDIVDQAIRDSESFKKWLASRK